MLRDDEERAKEHAPDEQPAHEATILCARCGAELTASRHAIAVEGKRRHQLVNPAGISFLVRTFGEAPGCAPYGESSSFFSWFSGHSWRISVCGSCGVHVGWRFEGASVFFGLIEERIAESS
jgi:hypothetical protein